jgi:hypothetical protein
VRLWTSSSARSSASMSKAVMHGKFQTKCGTASMRAALGFRCRSARQVQHGKQPKFLCCMPLSQQQATRRALGMGCVASRPPVLGDPSPSGNAQALRSVSKQVARQHRFKNAVRYTVKEVSSPSGTAAAGSGGLLQPFGSGTSQSTQSFTIGATGVRLHHRRITKGFE